MASELPADSGANKINGVSFSLKDDTHVRNQALAEAIAKALGTQVVGILEAETGQVPTFHTRNLSFVAMARAPRKPQPPSNPATSISTPPSPSRSKFNKYSQNHAVAVTIGI